MAMLYITRKEHFNGAHRLWRDDWTEEQNLSFYGICANPNYHGHNFDLEVTVKGEPNSEYGWVMNLNDLKKIIKREVVEQLDHKNFNLDVPWLNNIMPSIENIAYQIWQRIAPHLPAGVALHRVMLRETVNNYAEYFG